LDDTDIHVFCVWLDQPGHYRKWLLDFLSADEQERAERFKFDHIRGRFIVGRGVLRQILGSYLALRPEKLSFIYGANGKPDLEPTVRQNSLRFNVSHSGDLMLVAVTQGREVGVDVEQHHVVENAEGIARRFFSPAEADEFCALPHDEQEAAFFNCWTRKEAYVKARGDSFAIMLPRFQVSMRPGEPAKLRKVDDDPKEAQRWALLELFPASGYTAVVAVRGRKHQLHLSCFQWRQ
jgi:4'-phosphopantetheinyl transferase